MTKIKRPRVYIPANQLDLTKLSNLAALPRDLLETQLLPAADYHAFSATNTMARALATSAAVRAVKDYAHRALEGLPPLQGAQAQALAEAQQYLSARQGLKTTATLSEWAQEEVDAGNGQAAAAAHFIREAQRRRQPELDLSHMELRSLPACITHLSQLQVLNLGYNRLSALPSDMHRLTRLRVLLVEHNRLQALPAQLTKLACLEAIDASANALSALPEDMGNLTCLRTLVVAHNRLTEIPESLAHCANLELLYVGGNARVRVPRALMGRPEIEIDSKEEALNFVYIP